MYFLLANLSVIDLCLPSVTAPKMIADIFSKRKVISFKGCLAQLFILYFFWWEQAAICKPPRYTTVMCGNVCVGFVAATWGTGFLHSVSQLAFAVNLPFCGPNEVDSFYCDLPRVIKLPCTDIYRLDIMVITNTGVLTVSTPFKQVIQGTAHFAHITVVLLFVGPCIFIYTWAFPMKSLDEFLAVFYYVVTPVLNPIIYTLRNKDMKTALKWLRKWHVNSRVKS
ncbi:unnamed protein product [Nyctereutes procyonoides]|uniref:(raccoon dog) hypothetical protein n=1 Tax=Nyctereutes procyonoides TaxID=34880 RepID=A0A811XQA8_NYCPR|nr:unnamed protein product [Nyctereutes procyonoides]